MSLPALTRDTAAQMVWNALQAKEVGYEYTLVSENGQLVSKTELVPKATTLLESKYEGKIVEGTLSQFSYNTNKEEWTYEIAVSTSRHGSSKEHTGLHRSDGPDCEGCL